MSSIVKGTLKYTCDVLGFIFRSFDELEIRNHRALGGKGCRGMSGRKAHRSYGNDCVGPLR